MSVCPARHTARSVICDNRGPSTGGPGPSTGGPGPQSAAVDPGQTAPHACATTVVGAGPRRRRRGASVSHPLPRHRRPGPGISSTQPGQHGHQKGAQTYVGASHGVAAANRHACNSPQGEWAPARCPCQSRTSSHTRGWGRHLQHMVAQKHDTRVTPMHRRLPGAACAVGAPLNEDGSFTRNASRKGGASTRARDRGTLRDTSAPSRVAAAPTGIPFLCESAGRLPMGGAWRGQGCHRG